LDIATLGRSDGGLGLYRAHLGHLGIEVAKKNKLRPWAIKSWCFPKVSTRFIAKMEDVLAVYQRPYDPDYPMICLDEKGKELQSQRAELLLPKPGQGGSHQDYEYKREGSANLLLVCEPLTGWRRIAVSQDRTAQSFARQLHQLVEEDFPMAHKIVLVTDNLNIHGIWSLYEEFPAADARRMADKLEWHYTPEHGSWLNMAELELSAMQRQCLHRRFADLTTLERECHAWVAARNLEHVKIKWQFSSADARIRLHRLYPVIKDIT
jgi:transposase